MHQSWLKNHMCVLGWISRSHARNRNEIQTSGHHGSAGKIEKLGFLIPVIPKHAWKSWNLAWCHDMAPTCLSKFFGWIGTSFGVSFLQTGASLKKARGSEREQCMFDDEWEIASSYSLQKFSTCNLHWYKLSCENLENFRGHLTFWRHFSDFLAI